MRYIHGLAHCSLRKERRAYLQSNTVGDGDICLRLRQPNDFLKYGEIIDNLIFHVMLVFSELLSVQSTVGATATMTGEKTPVPEQVGTAEADLT